MSDSKSEEISIISKKFWISFFDYYFKYFKKLGDKSVKNGCSYIFNYGFDTLLFFAIIGCYYNVKDLKSNIGLSTVKGGKMEE